MHIFPINFNGSWVSKTNSSNFNSVVSEKRTMAPKYNFAPPNFAAQISQISFCAKDTPVVKNLSGEYKNIIVDKDTIIRGDAYIGTISVTGKDTKLFLEGNLEVVGVMHDKKGGSKGTSFVKVSDSNVCHIRDFREVKLCKSAKVGDITGADCVHFCDNSYANSVNTAYASLTGNSAAGNISAINVKLYDYAQVNQISLKPNGTSLNKPASSIVSAPNTKISGIDLNGNSCIFDISGKSMKLTASPMAKASSVETKSTQQTLGNAQGQSLKPKGFACVAGMETIKDELRKKVINPIKNERYKAMGIKPPNGVLLYGPPGCGKTYVAEALAEEIGRKYFPIKLSDIGSSYINATSANLKKKFDEAIANAPAVVFLDEIDSIGTSRNGLPTGHEETTKLVNELLMAANNCADKNILIIYATNNPDALDSALKRSGRIDLKIEISEPDLKTREELLKMYIQRFSQVDGDIDYAALAEQSEGFVSADFENLANRAAILAVEEDSEITQTHAKQAIYELKTDKKTDKKRAIGFLGANLLA